jgi:4-amino-4-deoxy-L-arabinose transferase-like glycosyltransferase
MDQRRGAAGDVSSPGAARVTDASETAASSRHHRFDAVLLLILIVTFASRLVLASTQSLVYDEYNTTIPLAEKIHFSGDHRYLPLRAINHPALPAYVVKASRALLDTTEPIGYRGLHVIGGLGIVLLAYLMTHQWYGRTAARWAAALMAFNEYSLDVGTRATAHVPFLFCVTAAVYSFSRFLHEQRLSFLYSAAVALAFAFYAKEHAALLLPLFFATLCVPSWRGWLRGPHVYAAAVLFFLIIAPDIIWNLMRAQDSQVTYGRHLQRIGGLGFSIYPTAFYAKAAVIALHDAWTGRAFDDNTAEYLSMNVALGVVLLAGVTATTVRHAPNDRARPYFLLLFWGVFGFFTLIRKGTPDGLDSVSWIWVDTTMIPAIVLTAAMLAGSIGRVRAGLWTFAAFSLVISVARVFA